MKARTCTKPDMACIVDVAEVMGQAQEGSSALHRLFLSAAKGGTDQTA